MSIVIKSPSGGGSISLDTQQSVTGDHTLQLPTGVGSAGQYLRNSGTAGTLEFGDLPALGQVINTEVFTNSTRASNSTATARTSMMTVSFNKTSSTSTLVFFGVIPGHGNNSGHVSQGVSYGTTSITGGWSYTYSPYDYSFLCTVAGFLSSHTTTGAQDFKVEYFSGDATAVAPFLIVNPNSTDDSRLTQQVSRLVIQEVEL